MDFSRCLITAKTALWVIVLLFQYLPSDTFKNIEAGKESVVRVLKIIRQICERTGQKGLSWVFVFLCCSFLSKTLQNSTSSTGHMPQKAPRECLAWLAGRHGLCSLVHATHFCVKLELSPHGQLVESCRALRELQPQHPFMPSTSLCIMCIDSPRRTRLETTTPTLD